MIEFLYKFGFIIHMKNSVNPDQLVSTEASWSGFTLLLKIVKNIEKVMQTVLRANKGKYRSS